MLRNGKRHPRSSANCFSLSAGLALLVTASALFLSRTAPSLQHTLRCEAIPNSAADLVPPLWRRLGCETPADVQRMSRTISRREVFGVLVDEYLAPWSPPVPGAPPAPISAALLDSMEVPMRQRTIGRVRLSTVGSVLYRILEHWDKTYRLPRFIFFLDLIQRALLRFPELKTLPAEFYVNAADGPRSTIDSASLEFAALPLFGFRTERGHIDIPVPDPVEHGAKVTGAGYVIREHLLDEIPRWEGKQARLMFRGTSSSIMNMHFGNWHLNPRVRVSSISSRYPELIDAGISKWVKLSHNCTVEEILASSNITETKEAMPLEQQLRFKYILDVDGGLGSSRKRWMLLSGSTPFFQQSTVYQWYEPLLVPWVHYVPVDKWFRNLVKHVVWARENDAEAKQIAANAREFSEKFLSDDAILEFIAVLLQRYATLMKDVRRYNLPVPNPCLEAPDVEVGPMGCKTDWLVYVQNTTIPFGCRHKPLEHLSFVCHRKNPITGRKEVKHGTHSRYDNEYDVNLRLAKELEAAQRRV